MKQRFELFRMMKPRPHPVFDKNRACELFLMNQRAKRHDVTKARKSCGSILGTIMSTAGFQDIKSEKIGKDIF